MEAIPEEMSVCSVRVSWPASYGAAGTVTVGIQAGTATGGTAAGVLRERAGEKVLKVPKVPVTTYGTRSRGTIIPQTTTGQMRRSRRRYRSKPQPH